MKSIYWVVSLKSEAFTIIKELRLFKFKNKNKFLIYKNDCGSHWLIISGIGKKNCLKAIDYLIDEGKPNRWTVWINIGIAGHISNDIGKLALVNKITDETSNNSFYPSLILPLNCKKLSLLTVQSPTNNYSSNTLVDMEGFNFYKKISKKFTKELIILIKIISDGPKEGICKINNEKIKVLFSRNILIIKKIIKFYESLSLQEFKRLNTNELFDNVQKNAHFTFSQKVQLKNCVVKLNNFFSNKEIEKFICNKKTAKDIITEMENKIKNLMIEY